MNNQIFFFLYSFAHRFEILDKIIIFFAVYFPGVVIIAAGLFLLFHHEIFKAESPFQLFLLKKKEILLVFFSGALTWALAIFLQLLFRIPRPALGLSNVYPLFTETAFSFPSGHTMFFSALAFELFLINKRTGYLFILFALIIGLARIAAGVHYPIDVLAGFILGFVVAYIVKKLSGNSLS